MNSQKPVGLYDPIDTYVEQHRHRLKIPGISLAIIEGDQIVHQRGFGRAQPDGEAPTPQTPFFIGSLTKSFTALAVMQLVECGKIDLAAPVQRYLPWFRVADSQASALITVRHLLNQTSGLPTSSGESALSDFDDRSGATERQARALATLVLARPIGSAFEYSNSNYNLLGLIIEVASGQSYADYIQEHILIPLEMNHTYTSSAIAKQNGLAMGHRYWFAIPFAAPHMPIPHGSLPAGLLISTAEDIAHYLIAMLNGGRYQSAQILSSTGIDQLHCAVAEYSKLGISMKYGMGWFVSELGQSKLVWHTGTLPDFGAYMALLPDQKTGVVLLFNANHHWMMPVQAEFGTGVATLLANQPPAPTPFVDVIPWILRSQLLIPIFQIAEVVVTLRLLRRWHRDPLSKPSSGRQRRLQIVLPLILNSLIALMLKPRLSKRRGYLKLYLPDYSLIAILCGGFALAWSFLRTALVLRFLK